MRTDEFAALRCANKTFVTLPGDRIVFRDCHMQASTIVLPYTSELIMNRCRVSGGIDIHTNVPDGVITDTDTRAYAKAMSKLPLENIVRGLRIHLTRKYGDGIVIRYKQRISERRPREEFELVVLYALKFLNIGFPVQNNSIQATESAFDAMRLEYNDRDISFSGSTYVQRRSLFAQRVFPSLFHAEIRA